MKLIFLDIDGVLNRTATPGKLGFEPECVANLNRILEAVPGAMIVVISAWRYMITLGHMDLEGFSLLLESHGVKCANRLHGYIGNGSDDRAFLIEELLDCFPDVESWVVIDDMELWFDCQVLCDPTIGLTRADADMAIEILRDSK